MTFPHPTLITPPRQGVYINMLSWANVSLIADGRSVSDIKQGVTLEVMGEGSSMGPLNDRMKHEMIVVSIKQDGFKPLIGRTLAQIAADRGQDYRDTVMDLIAQDHSRIGAVFFTMSEENVRKAVALPWVSFGSDAGSMAAEGVFLRSGTHPRAYGTFARVLGKYVREERVVRLEEAIRRMTSLPAQNLKLQRRGRLAEGYYADVVVFDPSTIRDTATFQRPHQYAVGVQHVFVNGVHVLEDGEHTGAMPGRVVKGPGAERDSSV